MTPSRQLRLTSVMDHAGRSSRAAADQLGTRSSITGQTVCPGLW
jgi:hypothetical protein